MHVERRIADRPDTRAFVLAGHSRERRLVVCAGAGVSMAPPTDLPSGAGVSELLWARVKDLISPPHPNKQDLLAVADRVESLDGGDELLQQVIPQLAAFTSAQTNYAHRALALLRAEDALELLLINWDDCVERKSPSCSLINAVVTDDDAYRVTEPRVYKLHGCARRRGTLRVTTDQIRSPSSWALDAIRGRLAQGVVVFLGVGDVPAYVRLRIEQLLAEVRQSNSIWVAARAISGAWDALVAGLRTDHKWAIDAEPLLDDLLRAYVLLILTDIGNAAEELSTATGNDITGGWLALRTMIEAMSGADFLDWILESGDGSITHRATLDTAEARELLLALSALTVVTTVEIGINRVRIAGVPADIIVSTRNALPGALASVAQSRATRLRLRGLASPAQEVIVLAAGHIGPLEDLPQPHDIAGSTSGDSAGDLIEGASRGPIRVIDARMVLNGQVPHLPVAP
jgi:hypothetical protein